MVKTLPIRASIESPTWGHVQQMAEAVFSALGGTAAASQKLSYENFYTLNTLAALKLDEHKSKAFIFGKQYLT